MCCYTLKNATSLRETSHDVPAHILNIKIYQEFLDIKIKNSVFLLNTRYKEACKLIT